MIGDPGGSAPCVFQPLRQVGKALDVELLLLRARSGPVTSSDKLRHPLRGPPPPLRLADPLKAEFRRPAQVPTNPPIPDSDVTISPLYARKCDIPHLAKWGM